jgi:hypothetical protein
MVERTQVRNKGDTSNWGLPYHPDGGSEENQAFNDQRTVTNLAQACYIVNTLMLENFLDILNRSAEVFN